ncbi:hypothetical protein M378DRAFT_89832, partial [Amanita muscaria Koide BX008]
VDTELLAKAFDNPLNKLSGCALEWFLVHKCLVEECSVSTAMSVYSAFTWYWDNMDGERYAGQYAYNEERGDVCGCLARAPVIRGLLKTIKARCAHDVKNQAEPMTIGEMVQMIRWSEQVVPQECLAQQMNQSQEQFLVSQHALMRALVTTAFTLWTRCMHSTYSWYCSCNTFGTIRLGDLCALQAAHVSGDLSQPPYNVPYFQVSLVNRKGWLRKVNSQSDLDNGRTFKIFKQDIPEIDMYTHLRTWIQHLESTSGRKLQEGDYIFPYMSPNSHIHPIEPISHDKVQNLLSTFTKGAGLTKHFKTHCFRRGGAQYRFMHAPLGKRWTLDMIQWWGGWASGEQTDMLIRYLVNSLQSQENDYSDALDLLRNGDPNKSLMGEHELTGLATTDELRTLGTTILAAIQSCNCVPTLVPTHPAPGYDPTQQDDAPDVSPMFCLEKDSARTKLQPQGYYVPSLGPGEWKKAIEQWHHGDPAAGMAAMKDWPQSAFSGRKKKDLATIRRGRYLIAMAYEGYGTPSFLFLFI